MSAITTPSGGILPANYRFLQDVIYEGSGIVLEPDKHYLLEARLASITRRHGLESIDDLCHLLRATNEEAVHRQVVEAMTTNETYFFREPAQYDAIRTVLLPELRASSGGARKLSFWSAAASTGQEAYSLAMLLQEEDFGDWNLDILGTDLSRQVLERARAGRYLQIEVNRGLPAAMLLKYFQRHGLEWQLLDPLRRMVRFEQCDLRQPMNALGPFDLVFCRNVLVYLDAATRRRILQEIHGTLFRGGWLLLGTAELPAGLDELYERRGIGTTTVYIAR
jgi:chemotaxis protein methyltransferase CheR